ncbi:flagellar basal body-associated FliL family protein [Tistrella mobilis]|uniref:flagellar basal body-associated FliL family protein n=2 Tax=Tistrella mobilis TaxID=171437 RepID=UPI003556A54D
MADEAVGMDGEGEGKKKGGKKLILFILLPLLLIGGGGAAAFLTGMIGGGEEAAHAEGDAAGHGAAAAAGGGHGAAPAGQQARDPLTAVYYDLPEMLVNLNTGGKRVSFLKLKVSLELQKQEDTPLVEKVLPRIIDSFQVYLREMRVEDLSGSAGIYRLREELLDRVNVAARPVVVNDVLFREMLVQ